MCLIMCHFSMQVLNDILMNFLTMLSISLSLLGSFFLFPPFGGDSLAFLTNGFLLITLRLLCCILCNCFCMFFQELLIFFCFLGSLLLLVSFTLELFFI